MIKRGEEQLQWSVQKGINTESWNDLQDNYPTNNTSKAGVTSHNKHSVFPRAVCAQCIMRATVKSRLLSSCGLLWKPGDKRTFLSTQWDINKEFTAGASLSSVKVMCLWNLSFRQLRLLSRPHGRLRHSLLNHLKRANGFNALVWDATKWSCPKDQGVPLARVAHNSFIKCLGKHLEKRRNLKFGD